MRPSQHVLEPLSGYVRLAERLLGKDDRDYAEAWSLGPADENCKPVSHFVRRIVAGWRPEGAWHLSEGSHPHEAHFPKVDTSKARCRLDVPYVAEPARGLCWTDPALDITWPEPVLVISPRDLAFPDWIP